jgi:hypothetical protein
MVSHNAADLLLHGNPLYYIADLLSLALTRVASLLLKVLQYRPSSIAALNARLPDISPAQETPAE